MEHIATNHAGQPTHHHHSHAAHSVHAGGHHLLQLDNVSVGFERYAGRGVLAHRETRFVVEHLSLSLHEGEILALVGASGSGKTLLGEPTVQTDIAEVARGLGVKRVTKVDAYDLKTLERVLSEELDCGEPSVVVAYGPCVIAAKKLVGAIPHAVDPAKCKACGACFRLGCPSIVRGEPTANGRFLSRIEPAACIGCGLCAQVCPFGAIGSTASRT